MRGKRVYLDTAVLIYGLENSPLFSGRALPFIDAAEKRQFIGITGVAGLAEMLVSPLREGNTAYAEQLKALFLSGDILECVSHSNEVFLAAAGIRARENLKMIDSIHFATALSFGCQFFLTNDAAFQSSPNMEVVQLSEIAKPEKS